MTATSSPRLLALDVLRGLTLAGMILVNNPGSWEHIYTPLEHAQFIGCTLADLVFPFFMFVMGFSIPFSMRKYDFSFSRQAMTKILRRTVLLFLIGIAFNLIFALADGFRILGVFQRLALCYGLTATLLLTLKPHRFPWLIGLLLIGYWCLLRFGGNGYEFSEQNIVSRLDQHILTPGLMCLDGGILFDPEGATSTIPALAHVMLGALLCWLLLQDSAQSFVSRRSFRLIIGFGVCSLLMSWILVATGDELCKKLWTPSFVFLTTGLAELLLALFLWLIDVHHWQRGWSTFFRVFGVNPLIMYVIAMMLEIIFNILGVSSCLYNALATVLSPCLASAAYAVLFVLLNWCIAAIFYWRKIIIKL